MIDEDDGLAAPASLICDGEGGEEKVLGRAKQAGRTPKKADKVAKQAPPTPPSSSSRTRTSLASTSGSSKVVVKLNGRIYRQPNEFEAQDRAHFEADLLLSEPTETIEDLEQERRAEKRRQVELEMKRAKMAEAAQSSPSSSPSKGKGRVLTFDDSDDEGDIKTTRPSKAHRTSLLATPTKASPTCQTRPSTPPPRLSFGSAAQATSPSPSLGRPFGHPFSPRRAASLRNPLPPPLAALLSLHSAVERSFIMHLSLAGSSIASSSSDVNAETGEAVVRMTNLIDLPTLSKMLESTGKRFGEDDLRRLVWLWEGCDGLVTGVSAADRCRTEDEAGGMGFIVSRARTSSAAGARISGTYGIGISVAVKANPQLPKFELVSPGRKKQQQVAPPSPSSVGKGREGMSIVALWTQGKEQRQSEVERRLRKWAEKASVKQEKGVEDVEADDTITFDWTTGSSSSSSLFSSLPRASLPLLNPAVPSIPSTSTPSPRKPSSSVLGPSAAAAATAATAGTLPVASPEKFVSALLAGKPVKGEKKGKAADRAAALRERIQAKQDAQKRSAYHASLSSLSSGESSPTKRSLKRHGGAGDAADGEGIENESAYVTKAELFKRNAMLSRLGSIADVVAMRCSTRPTRFDEVCSAVANSPLLAIGFDESSQSLLFLSSTFPTFCTIRHVGGEKWVSMVQGEGAMRPTEVKERVRGELERVRGEMEGEK
ncbi:hypothetical protein JCM8547_001897 [Rhodosporidiobolus lusitaniae]